MSTLTQPALSVLIDRLFAEADAAVYPSPQELPADLFEFVARLSDQQKRTR